MPHLQQALMLPYIFIFGLIIGSFLNVCIYRIPKKQNIITVPSHCTNCNERLGWKDLIPVISFVFLKGKCRHCGDRISIKYPVVELFTGIVFLITYLNFGVSVGFFSSVFLFCALIVISFIDLEHRIIPDSIVIALIIAGIFFNIVNTEITWLDSLIGFFAASIPLLIIAMIFRGGMGGGDIKLMAAAGLFLGWRLILLSLFIASIAGSIIGIGLMVFEKKKRKDAIPFGPFLATGIFTSLLYGVSIIEWYIGQFF